MQPRTSSYRRHGRCDGMWNCPVTKYRNLYSNGKLVFHSLNEVTDYLKSTMPKEEISMHIHTPEITIDSETTATGRWYLEDRLIFTDGIKMR